MSYGAGGVASGAVGAPAAATTLDNLGRYLSEYNHPNIADDDFWDEFWGPPSQPNFHWNLTNSGTNAMNGTITFNVDGNTFDANGPLGYCRTLVEPTIAKHRRELPE